MDRRLSERIVTSTQLGVSPVVPPSPDEGGRLGAAVAGRSWEWLLALRRRLNVDLEIVDEGLRPLLGSPAPPPLSTDVRALLASAASSLRPVLAGALETGTRQVLSHDSVQLVCVPLALDRMRVGALFLAQQRADEALAERARGALDLMGFWLSNAVEAHLSSPSAEGGDLDRLSSLCRLLGDTAQNRTGRDVVAAFAEALAIWHDFEVCGYVEAADGEFLRDVALAGADASASPLSIQPASLPEGARLHRLTRIEAERLGFSSGRDLMVMRLGDSVSSWLITVSGDFAARDTTRLERYLQPLEQAIACVAEAATARVVASLARHLLDDDRPAEEQASRALDDVKSSLGMESAALTLATATGVPLLSASSASGHGQPSGRVDSRHLSIVRRLPQHHTMAMSVWWSAGRRVTRRDHHAVDAAADLFESWVRRVARQTKDQGERRAAPRKYDEDLERMARQAVEGGIPVTAVVLSFSDAALRPGLTRARIGRLREHVRATDLVGRLDEGEIGMLLHNAPENEARAVSARLQQTLLDTQEGVSLVDVAVGFASWRPGDARTKTLADAAREDARRHAGDP